MKSAKLMCTTALALFAMLAIPVRFVAQDDQVHNNHHNHHQYKLIDLGTFGGPQSWVSGAFEFPSAPVNNAGTVVGGADTPNSNPNYPNVNPFLGPAVFGYADPFVFQAFKWDEGTLINLGTLPGGANSFADWISGNGLIAGASENGLIDPVNGYPEIHAVLWKDGQIKDLGTLGGGESLASAVNKRGQVTGGSFDAANNPRAFRWTEDQGLQDLGTLGGCCAIAGTINERGQISGESGLCDTCNQDAFLWEDGKMYRIPDFGGPISFHNALNNRGQVVGQSDLPGGANAHAFLWDKKNGVTDLGTLGGSGSVARWINDGGDVVGGASTPNDQAFHATLWRHRDLKIIDLGTADGDACSVAQSINSESQVVGLSDMKCDGTVLHAFLWEISGPAVDLNTFVPPGSGLQLTQATSINDRGEIAGEAITSNGNNHSFLLIPCGEDNGDGGCENDSFGTIAATENHLAPRTQIPTTPAESSPTPSENLPGVSNPRGRRYWPLSQRSVSPSAPIVSLQPASLDFGTVRYSQTKTLTTTLTNVGNATLTISSITITGTDTADFSQTHTCGSKVRAGKHCVITVTFKPIGRYNAQSFSADVSVSDNASGSPQTVTLSGTGYSICHVSCAQCPIRICQCFGPFGGCMATAAKESSRNLLDDPKPAPACANATQSFRLAAPN